MFVLFQKVLDKLLLYLRIVHSVDYYNHCEYPNEDEMPNRCGIMHARGIPPSTKVCFFAEWFHISQTYCSGLLIFLMNMISLLKQVTPQEVGDYCKMFEQKIASFLQPTSKISDEEYSKLGTKDADTYPFYS